MLKLTALTRLPAPASSASSVQRLQLLRFLGRHLQRLLADDVPTRGEDLLDLPMVELVRRRDVHDLYGVVREGLRQALVGARQPQLRGARGAQLRRRLQQPDDPHADPAQRLDVDRADEAAANDRGPDVAEVPHPNSGGVRNRQWPTGCARTTSCCRSPVSRSALTIGNVTNGRLTVRSGWRGASVTSP